MNDKPIGIFDSGIGGLTVAGEVMRQLPNENIIYFGDTARFPYGPRSADELKEFVFQIVEFLQNEEVKFIVIACNSASSAALEVAQEYFDIPIIGVVEPGARAAAQATRNRRIGIIGTQATISSSAYVKAVRTFDAGAKVFQQVTPELADFVENGELSGKRVEDAIKKYSNSLIEVDIDTLILGCTHYPLLSKTIQKIIGEKVVLISSAKEAAKEVGEMLARKSHIRSEQKTPCYRFISSGDGSKFIELGNKFLGREIKDVEKIKLG
ncbi:glutamate racemase [Candidatus Oleimmundimicrobium sp.]|uniref:glutamate racemase n=1 Tax=Candidatus Oleimmundimicrobium sp. TaxID=3060597 RepID=UPI00271B0281|nr:glutamate racemase [Candidatus Oleimmundimicrobium sp.]MDO8885869.1 glutamate racemase [Candidatus Oleimmundimicrobium sp.]